MRDNKFRIFDKQNKKYLSEEELKSTFINYKGKLVHATGGRSHYEWHEDRFVVEWYIGSKDENKKEVYRGDILQLSEKYGGSNYSHLVIENDTFYLQAYNINNINNKIHLKDIDICNYFVVGNIHEGGKND